MEPENETDVLIERYAERAALASIQAESFKQCLRLNHLPTEVEVLKEDGSTIVVRGQDLVSKLAWSRFFADHQEIRLDRLSYEAGRMAVIYARWLHTSYTDRYRALSTNDDLAWLQQVARLAVVWHLMLAKHAAHQFCDPWAE